MSHIIYIKSFAQIYYDVLKCYYPNLIYLKDKLDFFYVYVTL